MSEDEHPLDWGCPFCGARYWVGDDAWHAHLADCEDKDRRKEDFERRDNYKKD